jgi:hypothetical protein
MRVAIALPYLLIHSVSLPSLRTLCVSVVKSFFGVVAHPRWYPSPYLLRQH